MMAPQLRSQKLQSSRGSIIKIWTKNFLLGNSCNKDSHISPKMMRQLESGRKSLDALWIHLKTKGSFSKNGLQNPARLPPQEGPSMWTLENRLDDMTIIPNHTKVICCCFRWACSWTRVSSQRWFLPLDSLSLGREFLLAGAAEPRTKSLENFSLEPRTGLKGWGFDKSCSLRKWMVEYVLI